MTTEEIIDGLRMTAELFRFDPSTGGDALLNEEDRITENFKHCSIVKLRH